MIFVITIAFMDNDRLAIKGHPKLHLAIQQSKPKYGGLLRLTGYDRRFINTKLHKDTNELFELMLEEWTCFLLNGVSLC